MPESHEGVSGQIPFAVGLASVVRIPVPGTEGLCIEFRPRGWVPKGGSTSTVFVQDALGKRQLRLDLGYNVKTKTIDYHWNQKGVFKDFGISDHTPAGRMGKVGYQAAKYFKYGGRIIGLVGAAIDVVSIARASKPLRRASEVVSAWALAWVGCKAVGAGGAALGTAVPALGNAAGGVAGCIVGGLFGYAGGSRLGGAVYDWAEDTSFFPLPEVAAP